MTVGLAVLSHGRSLIRDISVLFRNVNEWGRLQQKNGVYLLVVLNVAKSWTSRQGGPLTTPNCPHTTGSTAVA